MEIIKSTVISVNDAVNESLNNMNSGNSVNRRNNQDAIDYQMKNKKRAEIDNLNKEKQAIENDLDAGYIQIGKRFMEMVASTKDLCGLEIQDVLRVMQPKMLRRQEIDKQIALIEKEIHEIEYLREKEFADLAYQEEKEKLDKALTMEVLTQKEYEEKLRSAKKKADNFDEIRRVNQQYDMNLISKEERENKIRELTS